MHIKPGWREGRVRLGFAAMGSYLHAEHDVDRNQLEPGLPEAQQPRRHVLDIGLLEWDLDAQVGLSRRFALELMIPLRMNIIAAEFERDDGEPVEDFTSIHHRDEVVAGIGDLMLGSRIGVIRSSNVPRLSVDIRAGATLPTGHTEPDPFVLGEEGHEHQHMFFGSGTVDPVAGVEGQVAFSSWNVVSWAQTKLPMYQNRHGYRASRLILGGVGGQTSFGLKRWSFLVQAEVHAESPARWGDKEARNSGRTSLLATAGAFASVGSDWQTYALAKVPYYTRTRGGQLFWPLAAIFGLSYTFSISPRASNTRGG